MKVTGGKWSAWGTITKKSIATEQMKSWLSIIPDILERNE